MGDEYFGIGDRDGKEISADMEIERLRRALTAAENALVKFKRQRKQRRDRLSAGGELKWRAERWWSQKMSHLSAEVVGIYVAGDGHIRFEVRDGNDQHPYHVSFETLYDTDGELDAAEKRIEALEAERDDLKSDVVAFCSVWAAEYARNSGFPPGELHPTHYDILEKCGARMTDFRRASAVMEG